MRALGLPAPRDRGLGLFGMWLRLSLREKLQSAAGTWKRVLRERLWRPIKIEGVDR